MSNTQGKKPKRKFSGDKRTLYLTCWHGHNISVLLIKVDTLFRVVEKHWHQGLITDAEYRKAKVEWEDVVAEYMTFLEGISEVVRAKMPAHMKPDVKPRNVFVDEDGTEIPVDRLTTDQRVEFRKSLRKEKEARKKTLLRNLSKSGQKKDFYLSSYSGMKFVEVVRQTDGIFRSVAEAARRGIITFDTLEDIKNGYTRAIDAIGAGLGGITNLHNQAELRSMEQSGAI